jgi:hypothetical protein
MHHAPFEMFSYLFQFLLQFLMLASGIYIYNIYIGATH